MHESTSPPPYVTHGTSDQVRTSSNNLRSFAGCLFPILGIMGAATLIEITGVKDVDFMFIVGTVGMLLGLLLAATLFAWLRMQALLAHRIVEYLDTH
jgi:hypothetical protein